jgi:hypothetical protein
MKPFFCMAFGAFLCAIGAVTVYYCLPPRKVEIVLPEDQPMESAAQGKDLSELAKRAAIAKIPPGAKLEKATASGGEAYRSNRTGSIRRNYTVTVSYIITTDSRYRLTEQFTVNADLDSIKDVSSGWGTSTEKLVH